MFIIYLNIIIFIIFLIIYTYYTLYFIRTYRKFNHAFLFGNNTEKLCTNTVSNYNIEKYKSRNIEFCEINKINIIKENNYNYSLCILIIFSIFILSFIKTIIIINNKSNLDITNINSENRIFSLANISSCYIIPIIALIPIIYVLNIIYKNTKVLDISINEYSKDINNIKKIFIAKVNNEYIFNSNIKSPYQPVELLKYIIIQKILYLEDCGSYEEAKNIYDDKFNITLNDKDIDYSNGLGITDYINFTFNSIDYKLLKGILCSNSTNSTNISIENINDNNINDIISLYLNNYDKGSNNYKVLEIINKLSINDFNLLSKEIKKLYLFTEDFTSYKKNIIDIIQDLHIENDNSNDSNNRNIVILYFNQLDSENNDWKIWQTLSSNNNNIFNIFSNKNCYGNLLNFEEKVVNSINTSINNLSNKINNIDTPLNDYINKLLYGSFLLFSIPLYILYHYIYKYYDKQKTIIIFTSIILLYIIEEVIRISFIDFN